VSDARRRGAVACHTFSSEKLVLQKHIWFSLRILIETMTNQSDPAAAAALAAAVAAAAEIAKNTPLFYSEAPSQKELSFKNNDTTATTTGTVLKRKNAKHLPKDDEEDAEQRLARSRERNRVHARRTRRRKKAQLEALQQRVTQLEEEARVLKQSIEECSIASILVGLSSGNHPTATDSLLDDVTDTKPSGPKVTMVGKRKRFVLEDGAESVPQPLKLIVGGKTTLIGGGKTHINWKSGVYCDEHGVQCQLTPQQLEALRYVLFTSSINRALQSCLFACLLTLLLFFYSRERNRMHAKMTRDRKKNFISSVEKTIQHLESENKRMRHVLAKVADMVGTSSESVTPIASPTLAPSITPDIQDECVTYGLASKLCNHVNNALFDLTTA